jgi:hypothetical protein
MNIIGGLEAPSMMKIKLFNINDFEEYSTTIACYKTLFDDEPPESVWESTASRFDRGNHIVVNLYRLSALIGMNHENNKKFLSGKRKKKSKKNHQLKHKKLILRQDLWMKWNDNKKSFGRPHWRANFDYMAPAERDSFGKKSNKSDEDYISEDDGTGKNQPRQSISLVKKDIESEEMSIWEIYNENDDDVIDAEDCVLRGGGVLLTGNIFDNKFFKLKQILELTYGGLYKDIELNDDIDLDDVSDAAMADCDILMDADKHSIEVHPDLATYEGKVGPKVEDQTFSMKGVDISALHNNNPEEEWYDDFSSYQSSPSIKDNVYEAYNPGGDNGFDAPVVPTADRDGRPSLGDEDKPVMGIDAMAAAFSAPVAKIAKKKK